VLLSLSFTELFSQNKQESFFSGGINLYGSTNKFTAGINFMYINKKSTYFLLNGNFGVTGYKKFEDLKYEKTDSFQVGNSNIYSYAYNIPNAYTTPYDQSNTIIIPQNSGGSLNNYHAKIKGYFINLSIGIPINRKKTFYTGTNTSYFWNADNGNYSYTQKYPTEQLIVKDLHAKFETLGLGFFAAYMYNINKRMFILPQLNFNFYFPIVNQNYGMSDGSNPLVGSEQDLTISVNYKF
jgi:hypothetical protein